MKISTRSLALCAVLTALALGLSYLENLFPVSLVIPMPGVKLGLANIVTVFALYELGTWPALGILLGRCLLGGVFAGNASTLIFSLMGGLLAMGTMILLKHATKLSIYGVSVGGAAAHNVGQIGAAMITLGNTAVIGYLPFLLLISLATGALTGFVTALLFRSMKNVHLAHE
jgi:heptaprenyl diphosphate synthase